MGDSERWPILKSDFATTRWSRVLAAGRQAPTTEVRQALQRLCQDYWYPLYAYVRRRVPDANEAQDLTQSFFAELLEKNYVGAAQAQRGRFRAFLLTALKHFLSKEWDKARALKRGGGRPMLSLDFTTADSMFRLDIATILTPEQVYDRQWAVTLLGQVLERLASEFGTAGKSHLFVALRGFVIGEHAGRTYAQAAEELKMTEAATKQAASRMRQRYRRLLREAIAETVAHPDEIEDELRNLFQILATG